jgi:hypothetical protein
LTDATAIRRPGTVVAAAVILYVCAGLQLVLAVVALTAIDVRRDDAATRRPPGRSS